MATNIIKTFTGKNIIDLERQANKYSIINCLNPVDTSLINQGNEFILVVLYENKFTFDV